MNAIQKTLEGRNVHSVGNRVTLKTTEFEKTPLAEPLQVKAPSRRKVMIEMREAWKKYIALETNLDPKYSEAEKAIEGIASYSAKDVEEFCFELKDRENEKNNSWHIGLFLSALINHGKYSDYVIHTKHFKDPPTEFGILNTKNIVVHGSLGMWGCRFMKSGNVLVNGSISDFAADGIDGGNVLVTGTVGQGSLQYAKKATVTIRRGIRKGSTDYHGFGAFSDESATVYITGGQRPEQTNLSFLKVYYKGELVSKSKQEIIDWYHHRT